ncbi:hypothetical protein K440DRAFT_646257 [Wilcoxina mikolae CBS 423.85]|nr:hypothetical protein K440DRAFT_646257 [Wilcoxina mikolae CBS 423.85]
MSAPVHVTSVGSAIAASAHPTAPTTSYFVQYERIETTVTDAAVPTSAGTSSFSDINQAARSNSNVASTVDAAGNRNVFFLNARNHIQNFEQRFGTTTWIEGPLNGKSLVAAQNSHTSAAILQNTFHLFFQASDNSIRRSRVATTGGTPTNDTVPAGDVAVGSALVALLIPASNAIHLFYQRSIGSIQMLVWNGNNTSWGVPQYVSDTFYAQPGTGIAGIGWSSQWRLYFHDRKNDIMEVGGSKEPTQVTTTEADLRIAAVNLDVSSGLTKHVLFKRATASGVELYRAVTTDDKNWNVQAIP